MNHKVMSDCRVSGPFSESVKFSDVWSEGKNLRHYLSTCKHLSGSSSEGVGLKCKGEHSGLDDMISDMLRRGPDDVPHNYHLYITALLAACGVCETEDDVISWNYEQVCLLIQMFRHSPV